MDGIHQSNLKFKFKMKYFSLIAMACLVPVFASQAQNDNSADRWKDVNNNTNITLESNGQVLINVKGEREDLYSERPFRIEVDDDQNSYFSIFNGTQLGSKFQPVVRAHYGTNYGSNGGGAGMYIYSSIEPTLDAINSNTTMMSFEVRRSTNPVFTTNDQAVQNVDLFRWRNLGDVLMLMNSNGELGINTSNPTARLHVDGSVRFQNLSSGTGINYLTTDANGNVYHEPLSNLTLEDYDWYKSLNGNQTTTFPSSNSDDIFTLGRVGIGGAASLSETPSGTTNPMPITLTVYGNSYASAGQWTSSDQRYKKDIQEIRGSANKVLEGLTGYSYHFNTDNNLNLPDGLQYGLMAQDIQKVVPQAVSKVYLEGTEIFAVNYQMLIPFLVEGHKEQQVLINEQQAQIEELSREIEDIKALLTSSNGSLANTSYSREGARLAIYPNPGHGLINIDVSEFANLPKDAIIEIYAANGKLLKKIRIENENLKIDLSGYAKGNYSFILSNKGEQLANETFVLE